MLPSILARQLEKGLCDYIETTFPMTNEGFKGTLDEMLRTRDSVYHEPYISVKMPFRASTIAPDFESIVFGFTPHLHQSKAFERLKGEDPRSTIVATGTGSGKTECFLYPVLEYCYKHRGESGIKAIIIYPMNALATDQAKRIAKEINKSSKLNGNVTCGMYVGGREVKSATAMGKENVITDHETLLSNPPDILLTNYKMLDYLMVRPKDAALWKSNNPETLKFIVVDELHTFDGAQGTDLACLLRRLKARLYTPKGYICCIGTSATLGDGESADNIFKYAGEIFGEPFENDAIITEDRLHPDEFFNETISDYKLLDEATNKLLLKAYEEDDVSSFLSKSAEGWLTGFNTDDIMSAESRLELAKHLKKHAFTRSLLLAMDNKFVQNSKIIEELIKQYPFLNDFEDPKFALDTLFALISHARSGTKEHLRPFLTVQVQLWMRELRRVVAKVTNDKITYALATDLNQEQAKHYLPIVNCRDCGATGWVTILDEKHNAAIQDMGAFYNRFFSYDDHVTVMYPHSHEEEVSEDFMHAYLCPNCLKVDLIEKPGGHACSSCGTDAIPVIIPVEFKTASHGGTKHYVCPHCQSEGIALLGLRSATTISATVSQMFASKFNDDKKTLTFSDNVQDAAHRAGFFNSRTWKFTLRCAMQEYALVKGDGLTLEEFQEGFVKYWREKLTDEEFVTMFIPANLTWMDSYEKMKEKGKLPADSSGLLQNIELRMKYEVMLEYGLNSRIGRTLEKTCSSILSYDNKDIEEAASKLKERVINERGELTSLSDIDFIHIVLGIVNRMRYNGAFDDKNYYSYINGYGKSDFTISTGAFSWMPSTTAGRNVPKFVCKSVGLTKKAVKAFDDIYNKNTKYHENIMSYFMNESVLDDTSDYIFETALEELGKVGLVKKIKVDENLSVYALNKAKMTISTEVDQFRCNECGQYFSFSKENSALWNNATCPMDKCFGKIDLITEQHQDYYRNLYNSGDIVRISAQEHTGLLDRSIRENVENEFKATNKDRQPWYANILSCTPTLEMGIDIGDLSSVILCSMPPAQSQYLQRTGRAGRKDGNSLTVTVANAKPHDLYFYSDPLEMIEGNVETPKVFLNASAVLERQFVAYCLDNWVKQGISENAIPKNIGICLAKLAGKKDTDFPFNFLKYVQTHLASLLRTFFEIFPDVSDTTKNELNEFAKGTSVGNSPMYMKIFEALESLKKQRDSISDSIKDLNKLIADIEAKPEDPAYEKEKQELIIEKTALSNVISEMNKKDVFNFFSDEGLLPNYAFPESGVMLKAVLRKKTSTTGDDGSETKKTQNVVYEYNRSASAAISEFAPLNSFYAGGRKLNINQIDLASSEIELWRLCPTCSHAEKEVDGTHVTNCPECGSLMWSDSGQLRPMLKVHMVYSNSDYSKSLIGDESDDRSVKFYNKQLLIDVDEEHDITKAYQMDNDDFSFGYEFVKKAKIREINFGESDSSGEKMSVSGIESVRKGFRICKYCGTIQSGDKPSHTFSCKARNGLLGETEPYEECLFLYRELETEALRLLIPATTLDFTHVKVESFEAAFMLGMKEYFGNVDHLKVSVSEVPVAGNTYRKQYLVIYDSVPGGTGYLKQLLQNENSLIEIFEKALYKLENCSCNEDPQKDGCYHCLYGYRQSNNIGSISRTTAVNLLKKILSGKDNIKVIKKIADIPVNSLFDSELERMFIESLQLLKKDGRPLTIIKDFVNNKEGFILKIGDCRWEIEPQVELGPSDGVSVRCKPDFVFWPDKENGNQKPIAVFTDGFTYHKDIVSDDTLKREAIRRSDKFRVWSFSFNDVISMSQPKGDYATATLLPEKMPSPTVYLKMVQAKEIAKSVKPSKVEPLELFAEYLENKDAEEAFKIHAQAYSIAMLNMALKDKNDEFSKWCSETEELRDQMHVYDEFAFGKTVFGIYQPRLINNCLNIYANIDVSHMTASSIPYVFALLNDDESTRGDKYEEEWNGFWQFFNMMQFSNNFYGCSTNGLASSVYESLLLMGDDSHEDEEVSDWDGIKEQIYTDEAIEFMQACVDAGIEAPSVVGYELEGDNGVIIAEGEMAWEARKIVFLTAEQTEENKEVFEEHGWTVIDSSNGIEILGGN